jgi:hypothetical protein
VVTGIEAWKPSRRWQEGYIKDAERFIAARMWEDPPPAMNGAPPDEDIHAKAIREWGERTARQNAEIARREEAMLRGDPR